MTDTNIQYPIKVILADDHPFYLEGVKQVLQSDERFKVEETVSNGEDLIEAIIKYQPDVCIVDISMPIVNGIKALEILEQRNIPFKAIALTMHTEDNIIIQMLQAGAQGYLDKNTSKEELFEAILSVVLHDTVYFPTSTSSHMFELLSRSTYKPYPKPIAFTEREIEIIQLICKDFTTKEISSKLYVSTRTIDSHRSRIMERMKVRSVAGLVAYAYSYNLLQ